MRSVLHSDVIAAARVLFALDAAERPLMIAQLVKEADCADRFTRRLGKPHPEWGNGTLGAAARQYPLADEPGLSLSEYCACLTLVLDGLVAHRNRH